MSATLAPYRLASGFALRPCANTLSSTVIPMTATARSASAWSSSRAISAKMIEARPRGPNHPMNATVGGDSPVPDQGERHRQHPDHGEAQHGVADHLPVGLARGRSGRRPHRRSARSAARPARPSARRRRPPWPLPRPAELPNARPRDERGDEAVAVEPERRRVRGQRQRQHAGARRSPPTPIPGDAPSASPGHPPAPTTIPTARPIARSVTAPPGPLRPGRSRPRPHRRSRPSRPGSRCRR